MSEITEIFVLKMKDEEKADAIREKAKEAFLALDGVTSWKTYKTTDSERQTLFAEIYTFPDYATAKKVTPEFATMPETKEFLGEIEEILVGQYFAEYVSKVGTDE